MQEFLFLIFFKRRKIHLKTVFIFFLFILFSGCLKENDLIETNIPEPNDQDLSDDSDILENARKCSGSIIYECIENNWKIIESCGEDMVCHESESECVYKMSDPCPDGLMICQSNNILTCKEGVWQTIEKCDENSTVCVELPGKSYCELSDTIEDVGTLCKDNADSQICSGNKVYQCSSDGSIKEIQNCSITKMQCSNAESVSFQYSACSGLPDGISYCEDAVVMECSGGIWNAVQKCNEGEFCHENSGYAQCIKDFSGISCNNL